MVSIHQSVCQLWHLLSPLGGEQVNYYPTSELKGLFLFRHIKACFHMERGRRVAGLK